MIESQSELDLTRHRLLDAAGQVFADVGFHNATVRAICKRAGANVAAVNYHFGGKEQLYTEVLRQAHEEALAKHPPVLEAPAATAEQRLAFFVRSFFLRFFDEGKPAWLWRLTAREMMEPTGALDRLVELLIRPRANVLESIVRELLPPGTSDAAVRRCMRSVIGQCIFYQHARPMVERLHPEQAYAPADIDELARHVTTFSLAALKHWPAEGGKS
jgi:TetR/AcrR family transcriptional regulator, regulator of cefoperazone and chloramphenicol sensitivity